MMILSVPVWAQSKTVSGRVSDEKAKDRKRFSNGEGNFNQFTVTKQMAIFLSLSPNLQNSGDFLSGFWNTQKSTSLVGGLWRLSC